jgi:hypothetical protein
MSPAKKPVTRDDVEQALQGLVDDSQQTVVEAGTKAAGLAGALAFLAIAVTYVLGRRRGSKAKSVVEVRRL